jgi:hypothetical protein
MEANLVTRGHNDKLSRGNSLPPLRYVQSPAAEERFALSQEWLKKIEEFYDPKYQPGDIIGPF